MLQTRGGTSQSHRMPRACRSIEPGEAVLHYNLACYWSLAKDRRQALRSLARALNIDGNFRDFIADEPDFDPLRNHPLFKNIVGVLD